MLSAPLYGQDTNPDSPPPANPATPLVDEEVIVVGEVRDRRLFDRRSYVVKDTPAAQTKSATEMIRDLPSVTIDANGRLRLLGNPSVKILIDGRATPNPTATLNALTANQVARVEVITNPSAEFASDGTAGVINVILRKNMKPGIGGTAAAGADTFGGGNLTFSPSFSDGPWSLSSSTNLYLGRSRDFGRTEQIAIGPSDGINNRNAQFRSRNSFDGLSTRAQVGYRLDQRRNLTATVNLGSNWRTFTRTGEITARAGEFAPFRQRSDDESTFRTGGASLEYSAEGKLPDQSFTASTEFNRYANARDQSEVESRGQAGVGLLRTVTDDTYSSIISKADYKTPRGKSDQLAVGLQFDVQRQNSRNRNSGTPLLGPTRDQRIAYGGGYTEGAAYATYQAGFGKWKLLSGLRAQGRNYFIDDALAEPAGRLDFFPSFHLQRPLSKKVDLNLSYSRRVEWPDLFQQLDLTRIYGATYAVRGNPALRPAFVNALEGKLELTGKRHNGTLTLFDRVTSNTVEVVTTLLPDGFLLLSYANVGKRDERGAEVTFQGQVAPRLRYSFNANVFAVDRRVLFTGLRESDAQYGGNTQLTYAEPRANAPGFDQIELNLRYVGPQRRFQFDSEGVLDGSMSWTHRYTPQLSSVLNVNGLFGDQVYRSSNRLPNLITRSRFNQKGPIVRLSLTYALAKPKAAPTP